MASVTEMYDLGHGFHHGIHPSAVVSPEAQVGVDVSVGPLSVIEAGAVIGDGSVIGPQCYIGMDAQIGANAFLRDHVTISARVKIGANFIFIHIRFSIVLLYRIVFASMFRLGFLASIGKELQCPLRDNGLKMLSDEVVDFSSSQIFQVCHSQQQWSAEYAMRQRVQEVLRYQL